MPLKREDQAKVWLQALESAAQRSATKLSKPSDTLRCQYLGQKTDNPDGEVGFLDIPLVVKYGGHDDQLSKKYWGMDRFRIKSLEKNLKNNWFTSEQKKIVLNILIKKLSIISNGAKKRDNEEIYKKYSEKFYYWSLELDKFKYE